MLLGCMWQLIIATCVQPREIKSQLSIKETDLERPLYLFVTSL